jgi:hypothetical protein
MKWADILGAAFRGASLDGLPPMGEASAYTPSAFDVLGPTLACDVALFSGWGNAHIPKNNHSEQVSKSYKKLPKVTKSYKKLPKAGG